MKKRKQVRRKLKRAVKGKVRAVKQERRKVKRVVRRKRRRREVGVPPLGSIGEPMAEPLGVPPVGEPTTEE